MSYVYEWHGPVTSSEVERLHAETFHHPIRDVDWEAQIRKYSLGWVCARLETRLVGFVNLAWDGWAHAFLVDTAVALAHRHEGIGTGLVAVGAREAKAGGYMAARQP